MNRVSQWVRDRIAEHAQNSLHVTEADRTNWNSKTDDTVANEHILDEGMHASIADKEGWAGKLDVVQSIENKNKFLKTDSEGKLTVFGVIDDAIIPAEYVRTSYVAGHVGDESKHINAEERMDYSENLFTFFNTLNIPVDTCNGRFKGKVNLSKCPRIDTSTVTDFKDMYSGCVALKSVPTLDFTNCEDMWGAFDGCSSLTSLALNVAKCSLDIQDTGIVGAELNALYESLDTVVAYQGITVSQAQYDDAIADKSIATGKGWRVHVPLINYTQYFYIDKTIINGPMLDTSEGTRFSYMFFNCTNLTTIPLLNTSKGTDFRGMFQNCSNLTTIPLIDTSKATDFSYMFYNCGELNAIPELNTSKGTNFNQMFIFCYKLTTIPLLNTSKGTNFGEMFYDCTNLTTIPLIDTSIGTNFNQMFIFCYKLTTIPLLNTSKGTNFGEMFYSCTNLTTIPLIDTSKGTNFNSMFYSCSKLESAQLSGCTRSVDISPTIINGANLDLFYTALGTAFNATQKIKVNATQLASGDASIATAKGWVVGV